MQTQIASPQTVIDSPEPPKTIEVLNLTKSKAQHVIKPLAEAANSSMNLPTSSIKGRLSPCNNDEHPQSMVLSNGKSTSRERFPSSPSVDTSTDAAVSLLQKLSPDEANKPIPKQYHCHEERPEFMEPLICMRTYKSIQSSPLRPPTRVIEQYIQNEMDFTYRCGSLPTRRSDKSLDEGGSGWSGAETVVAPGSLVQSKRQSTHFSEPALQNLLISSQGSDVGGGAIGHDLGVSLSAGASQHISPAGDLRSRSTSMVERPPALGAFEVLTDTLHRPECAVS